MMHAHKYDTFKWAVEQISKFLQRRFREVGFRIPKAWIPDSKGKNVLDSGFRIPLHGANYEKGFQRPPPLVPDQFQTNVAMRTFSQRGEVRLQLAFMYEKSGSEHWRSEPARRLGCNKYSAATGFGGFWGLGWDYFFEIFVLKIQNEIFFKKCLKSFACSWETSWCRVVSKFVVSPQSFCFSPCPELFVFISWFFISMAISIFGNRKLREFWDRGKPLVRSALAEDALFYVYLVLRRSFYHGVISSFHQKRHHVACPST